MRGVLDYEGCIELYDIRLYDVHMRGILVYMICTCNCKMRGVLDYMMCTCTYGGCITLL